MTIFTWAFNQIIEICDHLAKLENAITIDRLPQQIWAKQTSRHIHSQVAEGMSPARLDLGAAIFSAVLTQVL